MCSLAQMKSLIDTVLKLALRGVSSGGPVTHCHRRGELNSRKGSRASESLSLRAPRPPGRSWSSPACLQPLSPFSGLKRCSHLSLLVAGATSHHAWLHVLAPTRTPVTVEMGVHLTIHSDPIWRQDPISEKEGQAEQIRLGPLLLFYLFFFFFFVSFCRTGGTGV
jgi:hypothetical protein